MAVVAAEDTMEQESFTSSDGEEEEIKETKPVYKKKEILAKYEKIKLDLDWVERLDVTTEPAMEAPEFTMNTQKQEDDFKREIHFYRLAQAAVLEAIPKLKQLGIKTLRPEDYFAQMVKSDDHMKKVRENLQNKEAILARQEKAKALREQKKFSKKVQRETLERRRKEKKNVVETIKKRRKLNANNSDDTFVSRKSEKATARRELKDKKFGFGGRKKRAKYNTAQSAADVSGFGKGKAMKNKKRDGPSKLSRPGKQKRQNLKNRKKR